MKITKSLKKRHQGLMDEIKKEIKLNEKYLSETVSDHEKLRFKKEARHEAEKVHKIAHSKNIAELKEFKKSK
jgi:hypothetical protein